MRMPRRSKRVPSQQCREGEHEDCPVQEHLDRDCLGCVGCRCTCRCHKEARASQHDRLLAEGVLEN